MSGRYALLALLSEGPRYGLQLREEFAARTGEVWPQNVGQLYAALNRLERDGLVEPGDAEAAGLQKLFRITADGAAELAAWLRTPSELASPPQDQVTAKVLAALRVPGTDVHELVQVHRRHLVERMQQRTQVKQNKAGHPLGLVLKTDAELFELDSVIRWLDAADSRLLHATASPPRPAPPTLPRLRSSAGVPPGRAHHQGTSRAADDHIRVSDGDRERATARLCDHFAEGRLTREELDERITAALDARTTGDLRRVTADLPGPTPPPQPARPLPTAAVPRPVQWRRGPPSVMLVALALLGMLLITGGGWPPAASDSATTRPAAATGVIFGIVQAGPTCPVESADHACRNRRTEDRQEPPRPGGRPVTVAGREKPTRPDAVDQAWQSRCSQSRRRQPEDYGPRPCSQ
jgi:DNA-binding PadR family transcriptional regulator